MTRGALFTRLLVGTALLPLPALAQPAAGICASARPNWDGTPATLVTEAWGLLLSPLGLVLLATLAVATYRGNAMAVALTCLLWSFFISFMVLPDPDGLRAAKIAEGCAAAPTLFIGLVAAICGAAALYTFRRDARL